MVTKQTRWDFKDVVRMIVSTLLNKYDCFSCIEGGGTGVGKSTLAIDLAIGVRTEFRRLYRFDEEVIEYYYNRIGIKQGLTPEEFIDKILKLKEKNAYVFKMKKDLIYSQKEMQQGLVSYNRILIPDEMVNVTFNRDFYSSAQKDIIKMINMFRDHENLIFAYPSEIFHASVPTLAVLSPEASPKLTAPP